MGMNVRYGPKDTREALTVNMTLAGFSVILRLTDEFANRGGGLAF